MPVCGYVVVPHAGTKHQTAEDLARLDGCDVFPAENHDLLIMVTHTASFEADVSLRRRVDEVPGVQALLLTFGEIDPDTPVGDPVREAKR